MSVNHQRKILAQGKDGRIDLFYKYLIKFSFESSFLNHLENIFSYIFSYPMRLGFNNYKS